MLSRLLALPCMLVRAAAVIPSFRARNTASIEYLCFLPGVHLPGALFNAIRSTEGIGIVEDPAHG